MTLLAAESGVRGPDLVMIVGYFVLMIGIGLYFYRFMRGMKMYFSGGNKIPWWLSGVSFYMSSFSAYAFVIYSGLAYEYGWVAVTLFWVTVPATIFSVVFYASRWRRARIDSPVEFLETRYSGLVRQLFVWEGLPVGMIDDSLKMIATGTIVSVGMGFPLFWSIVISGLIMLAYTFMGGIWAVAVTDFVQFVILTVAVLIVFPLAIAKVGGFTAMVQNAPAGFFHLTTPKHDWIYVALLVLLYCVAYSSTNWPLIQKYYCVPTEKDARKMGWLVVVLNVIGPPLMFVPAMAASQFLPGFSGEHTKEVYPRLCMALLPVGMLGLIIAAMFSSTMSNLSSHFNVRANVLTNDVYRRLLHPHATEKELVVAGRAMTILVGLLTMGIAVWLANSSARDLFKYMVTLFSVAAAPLGIPMLLGLVSKRVNNKSAIVGLTAGITIGLALFACFQKHFPEIPAIGMQWVALDPGAPDEKTFSFLGHYWEGETVIFASTGLVTLIGMFLVSAIWPAGAAERERVRKFHDRLETPIGGLPEDVAPAAHDDVVMSPFGVVGISVICIGIMMLGIQYWVEGTMLAKSLNLGLGLGLIVIGYLMRRGSVRSTRLEREAQAQTVRETEPVER